MHMVVFIYVCRSNACMYRHTCGCVAYMYVDMSVLCIYLCTCACVCCVYVHTCVYMHICVYVCTIPGALGLWGGALRLGSRAQVGAGCGTRDQSCLGLCVFCPSSPTPSPSGLSLHPPRVALGDPTVNLWPTTEARHSLHILGPGRRVTHGHEHAVCQDGDHDEHAEQRWWCQGKCRRRAGEEAPS